MSLKSFHVLFIGASVLLAFYFAAWCLTGGPAGAGRVAAGLGSLATGVGLIGYEAWFLKKMRGVR